MKAASILGRFPARNPVARYQFLKIIEIGDERKNALVAAD
jgi:hypothetical protein